MSRISASIFSCVSVGVSSVSWLVALLLSIFRVLLSFLVSDSFTACFCVSSTAYDVSFSSAFTGLTNYIPVNISSSVKLIIININISLCSDIVSFIIAFLLSWLIN